MSGFPRGFGPTELLISGAVAGLVLWGVGILLLSATARPVTLGPREEKSIGFFDPHLHLSVVAVARSEPQAEPAGQASGSAVLAVRLRARNDAARITVDPRPLRYRLLDGRGQELKPLPRPPDGATMTGCAQPIERGETCELELLFPLPADTRSPALWITEDSWLARFMPGHENSFFHPRVVFDLEAHVESGLPSGVGGNAGTR